MELQSYDDCMANRHLFLLCGVCDGCFVHSVGDNGFQFFWFAGGRCHRVDGPAIVTMNGCFWFFWGGRVDINSQVEFERWLVGNA